jgi:MFS family permease
MEKLTADNQIEKVWNRKFIRIFIIGLLFNSGIFMMNTLVPKYLDHLGDTPAVIGVVASVFFIAALGIRPIAGPAMDYFRKERLLRWMILLLAVSFVSYGLSTTIPTIVASRILHGAACGIATPLLMAMAGDALPREKMGFGIGVFYLTSTFAMALGPSLGLWMAVKIGYMYTFFVLAGLLLLSIVLTFGLHAGEPDRSEGFRITLDRIFVPTLWTPVLLIILNCFGGAAISNFIILFGELRGIADVGLYFTANAIAVVIARVVCSKLADKYGMDKIMIPGFIIYIISFVITGAATSLNMFLVAGIVQAFGFGVTGPLLMAMCMQLVPKSRYGAASNSSTLGSDVGLLVGGALAGFLVSGFQSITGSAVSGYSTMFYCMMIPCAAALVIFVLIRKKLLQLLATMKEV